MLGECYGRLKEYEVIIYVGKVLCKIDRVYEFILYAKTLTKCILPTDCVLRLKCYIGCNIISRICRYIMMSQSLIMLSCLDLKYFETFPSIPKVMQTYFVLFLWNTFSCTIISMCYRENPWSSIKLHVIWAWPFTTATINMRLTYQYIDIFKQIYLIWLLF